MRRLALLPLPLLLACPPAKDGTDSGGDSGDTGGGDGVIEEGCITIDGDGGYGEIDDAVGLADEGSTIALCAGTYNEAVVLNKAVNLVGVEGAYISPPSNEVAITITASDVTVSDLELDSTRTGIDIADVTGVTLSGLTVNETGGWAVTSADSEVTITDSSFALAAAGAIEVAGGSATLSGLTISDVSSYAVSADGAEVSLSDSTISLVAALGDEDGVGVYATNSTITSSGNVYDSLDFAAYFVDTSSFTVSGDSVTDAAFGGIIYDGAIDISGLTLQGAIYQGLFLVNSTSDPISLSDSTISVDAGAGYDVPYKSWGTDTYIGGALLIQGAETSLTNVATSGYETFGIVVFGLEDGAPLTMDGVTVTDAGRRGILLSGVDATIANSSVTGLREPEIAEDEQCYYVEYSAAIYNSGATIALDNVTLSDNDGWGVSNLYGTVSADGSTFSENSCAGIINYGGLLEVDSSAYTGGAYHGAVVDYSGVSSVTNSSFTGCLWDEYSYSYEYDGVTYEQITYGYGYDIQGNGSIQFTLIGNTFEGGEDSVYLYGGLGEITGNTWSGYDGTVLSLGGDGSGDTFVVTSNTADDIGGGLVSSSYAEVEVSDFTVGTTRDGTYGYASYADGVLQYSYTGTTTSYLFTTSGYYYDDGTSVTEQPGSLSLTDVTVGSANSTVLYAYEASLDVENLSVDEFTGDYAYAVYLYNYSMATDTEMAGVTFPDGAYYGIYAYNYSGQGGTIALDGFDIGSTTYYSIYAYGLSELTVSDATFGTSGSTAITSVGLFDYSGILDLETVVTLEDVSLTGAGGDGVALTGGSLEATGLAFSGVSGDHISSYAASAISVTDSTFEGGQTGLSVEDSQSIYDSSLGQYLEVDANTVTTLSGVSISDPSSSGVFQAGGALIMSGCTVSGATGSGLVLNDVNADVQGNSLTANDEYGMVCVDGSLAACATNDLSSNVLGTHSGCDDACGL